MNDVGNRLKKEYTFGDYLFYMCLLAVPVLTAAAAVTRHSPAWTVLYLVFSAGMAALMLKFFCTRCPHYTREGSRLKCIFFWNFPKFFKPRAGRYGRIDLAVTVLAAAAVAVFPLYWLLREPGLLMIYLLSTAGFGAAIYRNECRRCIHSACPMNRAGESPEHSNTVT
jgi:hypothetical protein